MGAKGTLGNRRLNTTEERSKGKTLYQIDVAINWILIGIIALSGFRIGTTDIDRYQAEKAYVRLLNDGMTEKDYPTEPRLSEGIRRNMQYKGYSSNEYLIEFWKWRIPIYLVTIVLPILVAFRRVLSNDLRKWNLFYFPAIAISLGYGIYHWGRWTGRW